MHSNRAFWRAINSLIHPVSIAAVLFLLLNDHWLRLYHASWLTGKLGDFTWLLFAPFIAAVFFSWLIPRRLIQHEQVVGLISFSFIGIWFALAKTVTPIHELTVNAWEAIIGWQGTQRMDATDLLTLPALLVGWWIFWRVGHNPLSFRPIAPVLFALGIVATLASDGPIYQYTDSGVTSICQMGSQLVIATETDPLLEFKEPLNPEEYPDPDSPSSYDITPLYKIFTSKDGGLSWTYTVEDKNNFQASNCSNAKDEIVSDPNNAAIQYRWKRGDSIERSTDGGQNWITDYSLIELQQDVRFYYNHASVTDGYGSFNQEYILSPVSGLIDATSGNLVLAMSWDGVLVRTPEGKWEWVAVGNDYQLANINDFSKTASILFFELWLSGALGFLVITSSTAYMRRRVLRWKRLRIGELIIGWIGWLLLTILITPMKAGGEQTGVTDYFVFIGLIGLVLLVFLAIPLSIGAIWDMVRNFRSVWRPIVLVALGLALLYIFPFILWSQGTIPRYTTALIFSLLLSGAGIFAGAQFLKKRLPLFYNKGEAQLAADKNEVAD